MFVEVQMRTTSESIVFRNSNRYGTRYMSQNPNVSACPPDVHVLAFPWDGNRIASIT